VTVRDSRFLTQRLASSLRCDVTSAIYGDPQRCFSSFPISPSVKPRVSRLYYNE
jgi:hypothetical protein